ncbi:MAG: nucleoside triphosphate pyrophosphohydrolase [Rhodospirillaceae bacterium]|nr:nucleoside triphosphate pyrophosphohydrolase [Rhodospirillaceae bacterium]
MIPTSKDPVDHKTLKELERLIRIMRKLRDPQHGCPWDVKQTLQSIAPYTIEEAYEVADAIARGDDDDIRDELGDLLLQVIFHARMAEESGGFALADVAKSINDKMVARHPHVFGSEKSVSIEQQNRRWEDIKAVERARRGQTGTLDDVAAGLPPMLRALKLQRRAARVGFDWPEIDQVIDKLHEETAELKAELLCNPPKSERDQARVADEVGDILFVAINLARKAGIDPETALMRCNSKFEQRFRYIEQESKKHNKNIKNLSLNEMEILWQAAKSAS